jgi:hypothetical protein
MAFVVKQNESLDKILITLLCGDVPALATAGVTNR